MEEEGGKNPCSTTVVFVDFVEGEIVSKDRFADSSFFLAQHYPDLLKNFSPIVPDVKKIILAPNAPAARIFLFGWKTEFPPTPAPSV